jgi:hypothetical protein
MNLNKRQLFLTDYLTLLGAEQIVWTKIEKERIWGTVVCDSSDPEERQGFAWSVREDEVPDKGVMDLMRVIKENKFMDIDKLDVAEAELFRISGSEDYKSFSKNLDDLLAVKVPMVDEGEEGDFYFIHM